MLLSASGAALAALCGLLLYLTSAGDALTNASYDYLFRFGSHSVTNPVVLILMDNASFDEFHQNRDKPWDRNLHAQLLNKLADDGCAMVAFDSFFRNARDEAGDEKLAAAMKRQRNVVLMAEQAQIADPDFTGAEPLLPLQKFLVAATTNWGVAWLNPDFDMIARKHWPFPSPGPYPSLPWKIAQLCGAKLDNTPKERWLRYYGEDGNWTQMSYRFAFTQPKNYFRGKIVFIGTEPKTSLPNGDSDKFSTPYTRWTGAAVGGTEILVTSFLNLMNGDWLRRPPEWVEICIFLMSGVLLGGGLCRMKFWIAAVGSTGAGIFISAAAISGSYFTNFWFPWLIVVAAQIPCGLAWAAAVKIRRAQKVPAEEIEKAPEIPGYKLIHPPFGKGAYGKVWLAKNSTGQWRAVKVIYLKNFDNDAAPYDREFNGVNRYKPISDQHPGLLRVDFVSEKRDDCFFYVMELGDSLEAGWQQEPQKYTPHDLAGERARSPNRRLSVAECLRVGIALADALEFLHRRGLTHRDIKPQNIIFVNGQPKMADLGLIAEIRPIEQVKTYVGTPGYMPPPPEPPGTPQADIYALGVLLYVMSTGRGAAFFPEIATTLVDAERSSDFLPLNTIILKACHPEPAQRYASAGEMKAALQGLAEKLNGTARI